MTIETERFLLRELTPDDATPVYLSWFGDAAAGKYITSAAAMRGLSELRTYIGDRVGRSDVLFLGIFDRVSGAHIGNIKYEPVDRVAGYAIMGVLIGDPAARGRGVTGEVLRASGFWLRDHRQIREIVLGVDADNIAAIRAYEKVGFVRAVTPHITTSSPDVLTMVWSL